MHQGPFLLENWQTALAAISLLRENNQVAVGPKNIANALKDLRAKTGYIGRWQVLQIRPLVIADSAHNEEALRVVVERIMLLPAVKVHCVVGFVKDKNWMAMLDLFPTEWCFYFVAPNIPRALPLTDLMKGVRDSGKAGKAYTSVRRGLSAARMRAGAKDVIFIGGSTFVVAEVLGHRSMASYP